MVRLRQVFWRVWVRGSARCRFVSRFLITFSVRWKAALPYLLSLTWDFQISLLVIWCKLDFFRLIPWSFGKHPLVLQPRELVVSAPAPSHRVSFYLRIKHFLRNTSLLHRAPCSLCTLRHFQATTPLFLPFPFAGPSNTLVLLLTVPFPKGVCDTSCLQSPGGGESTASAPEEREFWEGSWTLQLWIFNKS